MRYEDVEYFNAFEDLRAKRYMSKGLVIKNTGSWYVVKYGEDLVVNCKVKGNFRLKGIRTTNPVAVGDIVDFIANDDGTAYITAMI